MVWYGAWKILSVVVFTSIAITWSPFSSTTYPYTIDQPSSFQHIVISNGGEVRDAFFPGLGSFTTNVNIYGIRAGVLRDERAHHGNRNDQISHPCGSIRIMGQRQTLLCASFHGLAGKWTIEQVVFPANGYMWHLTASSDLRYLSLRGIMHRMLRSFHTG